LFLSLAIWRFGPTENSWRFGFGDSMEKDILLFLVSSPLGTFGFSVSPLTVVVLVAMPRHHHHDRPLQEQEEKQEARSSIIGQDLQINEADRAAIQDTEDYEKMPSTMRNYRNRIQEICEWMQKECSDYAELGGVALITDAQKRDRSWSYSVV
jgi:hypothetical protein